MSRNKAIAISGLSSRPIDYWARTGLVEPAVDTRVGPGRRIRLYGFLDLLALMVAAQLRTEYRISLQHIRRIVEHLKSPGTTQPLTQLRVSVHRVQVHFQHPDGQWEGDLRPEPRCWPIDQPGA
ncbi:MAG: MerR family transcriptional regulator [Pseudonocardiaceae bacterium]